MRLGTRTPLQASWELFRTLLDRLWGAPATLLDGSWPLLARLGRPKIGFGGAFGRPKAVLSASRCVPEAASGTQNAPRSILRRIGIDLGWIFVDFRTILHRFSFEARATKARKQNLKKRARDPHGTSGLLRSAVASYCSHVFRDDFRTLRVQLFFVAYPQLHLV